MSIVEHKYKLGEIVFIVHQNGPYLHIEPNFLITSIKVIDGAAYYRGNGNWSSNVPESSIYRSLEEVKEALEGKLKDVEDYKKGNPLEPVNDILIHRNGGECIVDRISTLLEREIGG